jgi:5-methylcytosine-specific restriction protein A
MPYAARNICREPGCGRSCTGRYCTAHTAPGTSHARLDKERYRGSAASRGYGRRWEQLRKMVLARDPLCRIAITCQGMRPSTDADHIIPKRLGGEDTMENLQGACHACHSYKTRVIDSRGVGGSKSLDRPSLRTAHGPNAHAPEMKNNFRN